MYAFWAEKNLPRKIVWIFLFLPMFFFLFVAIRHIPNINRSRLHPLDVKFNLIKDFSSQLFVLKTLKLK